MGSFFILNLVLAFYQRDEACKKTHFGDTSALFNEYQKTRFILTSRVRLVLRMESDNSEMCFRCDCMQLFG